MNLLIVDDEQHAREAVKLLVPWNEYGIKEIWEADNGEEAKRIITEMIPDIVITDMHMPISGGAALMEWIQQHVPSVKMIVISGYSDFEYCRHALKYGGLDYLLKPIDESQLSDTVGKAIQSIQSERKEQLDRSRKSIEMNQFKPVYWNNLFSRLLNDPSIFTSVREQLEQEFGCPAQGATCRVAVCSLNPIPPLLLRRFRGDRDLLLFAVTNIMNDLVRLQWKAGYAFPHWNRTESIVIVIWSGLKLLPVRLQEMSDAIYSTLKTVLNFGVGSEGTLPDHLGRSAEEAFQALNNRNLLVLQPVIHWYDPSADRTDPLLPHIADTEKQLQLALISRNESELKKLWTNWMDQVRRMKSVTPEFIEIWVREFLIMRGRLLQSLFGGKTGMPEPDDLIVSIFDEKGQLSLDRMEDKLLQTLMALMRGLEQHQREERNIVGDIKNYIDHHLNEDVSLQKLAARFYLSREYVSRRFRQETGQTLSDYVESLRVEKAKLLLGNPVLRINEIAQMVGYPDEKYFSKVFKKQTGVSPKHYRKHVPDTD